MPPLFFGLGERGKPAEAVADDAADEAIALPRREAARSIRTRPTNSSCRSRSAPMPASTARREVTRHLTTNIETVRKFVDRDISASTQKTADPGPSALPRVV